MYTVDLNSDLGESLGAYTIGADSNIIPTISSANIACGFHAGDALVMDKTVLLCKNNGVAIGAHPGFPDILGFGRRNMQLSPKEVKAYVKYQIGALQAFTTSHQVKLQHVKPHGALYNMAATDINLALAIVEAIKEVNSDLILLGLANSYMISEGNKANLKTSSEVFADRAYNNDGTLVSRSNPNALIHNTEECILRVIRMVKESKVTTITGEDIHINAQSICVHGDTPKAEEFIKEIKKALTKENIIIQPLSKQL